MKIEYMTKKECEECRKNAQMSPQTKEEISAVKSLNIKMQQEVTEIKESQIRQSEQMKYMRITMNNLDMKMTNFIASSDRRYASKLAERIVYSMAGLILTGAIVAMLTLIYK
jgi:hypothetical protein